MTALAFWVERARYIASFFQEFIGDGLIQQNLAALGHAYPFPSCFQKAAAGIATPDAVRVNIGEEPCEYRLEAPFLNREPFRLQNDFRTQSVRLIPGTACNGSRLSVHPCGTAGASRQIEPCPPCCAAPASYHLGRIVWLLAFGGIMSISHGRHFTVKVRRRKSDRL